MASGNRVLTWCAPWEDSATFTSHRPTLCLLCECRVGMAATRVMWTMRSVSQGLSKSESHLASPKGDGSPTRKFALFRGARVWLTVGFTDSSRNDLCAPGRPFGEFGEPSSCAPPLSSENECLAHASGNQQSLFLFITCSNGYTEDTVLRSSSCQHRHGDCNEVLVLSSRITNRN
jgi:hypothetical protein